MNFRLFAGLAVGIAAFTFFFLWANTTKGDIVEEVLGCRGDPCVVAYNGGGTITTFEEAARAIRAGARKQVVINGACYSACTILIDALRDRTCVTAQARLGFHRGSGPVLKYLNEMPLYWYAVQERFDITYSPKIQKWINGRGGLPEDGSFIYMNAHAARTIWPACPWVSTLQAHGLY